MTTDFNKMTVMELRAELKKHGLTQAGKKADLVQRLQEHGATNGVTTGGEEAVEPQDARDATKSPESKPAASPTPAAPLAPSESTSTTTLQVTVPTNSGNESVTTKPELTNEPATDQPQQPEPVTTTTINMAEDATSNDIIPAVLEVVQDVQNRKRRSRTPSIDGSVRKRLRPDDPEPRRVDTDMDDVSHVPTENADQIVDDKAGGDVQAEMTDDKPAEVTASISAAGDNTAKNVADQRGDIAMMDESESRMDVAGSQENYQDYPDRRTGGNGPDEPDSDINGRPVVPSIHPATSAIYIKNFMRPLRADDVKDHVVTLATAPSKNIDPDVVLDFFLDRIRTHAFVRFNTVSAASRVRSGLHDQVWPDERNRKALWVDFIPAEKVAEWIDKEEADGSRKFDRWEVVYEADEDGNMTARLEEAAADTARPNPRSAAPPTGPASSSIPTGPSQATGDIHGAPTGPRGRGGRMPPGYPLQGGVNSQEGFRATRSRPSLLYKPASEDVARSRIDNMRSFYTQDRNRDMGPVEDINRYTFENVDSFVDRGKEVFVGIRPPHRQRERDRQARTGGGGNGRGRGPRGGGPPPPSYRPRGDRYMGGGGGRDNGRDDFAPRSRLDGAPLPTYDGGRPDRRGRNGYGGYRR